LGLTKIHITCSQAINLHSVKHGLVVCIFLTSLIINNMKNSKTYALVALLLIALTLESCASRCAQQRRYWATHRHV
jgi:hypothetical protein